MVKFGIEFLLLKLVDQETAVFQWKRGRFCAICPSGAQNGTAKSGPRFLLLCRKRKKRPFFNGNGPFLAKRV